MFKSHNIFQFASIKHREFSSYVY